MNLEFHLNPHIDLRKINDSMELDSGQTIAELRIDNLNFTLEVRGHVNITYTPNSDTTHEGGDVFRGASDFPEELLQMFHDGKCGDAPNVYVDENNWFEVFIEENGRFVNSECVDAETMNPAEIFSMLWETYQDYVKETKDEHKTNEVQNDNMPEQILIKIQCDEGHVADSLHELANAFENEEDLEEFETAHCCAEVL